MLICFEDPRLIAVIDQHRNDLCQIWLYSHELEAQDSRQPFLAKIEAAPKYLHCRLLTKCDLTQVLHGRRWWWCKPTSTPWARASIPSFPTNRFSFDHQCDMRLGSEGSCIPPPRGGLAPSGGIMVLKLWRWSNGPSPASQAGVAGGGYPALVSVIRVVGEGAMQISAYSNIWCKRNLLTCCYH